MNPSAPKWKEILTDADAQAALAAGVNHLADVVGATMGPRGRNVAIERPYNQSPVVTNDGVTIAQSIDLKDRVQNMGAQFIKQVAARANEEAGDGTTTATTLAAALLNAVRPQLLADPTVSPVLLRQQLNAVLAVLVAQLTAKAQPGTDYLHAVAHIASGEDEDLATQLTALYTKLGPDAVITLEDSAAPGIETEAIDGLTVNAGWLLPHMVTDPRRNEAVASNAKVLVIDRDLSDPRALVPLLEKVLQAGDARMIVFCRNMREGALATVVANIMQKQFYTLVVKTPGGAEALEDIAALTGATLIHDKDGKDLKSLTLADLGEATKVVATRSRTTVVGAADAAVHITGLEAQLADPASDLTKNARKELQDRIAKLRSGVGVVRVGAATEVARYERKLRVEDAINATAAALKEGVVPGGGAALAVLAGQLRDPKFVATHKLDPTAANIMARVCEEPLRRIAANAGQNAATIVEHVTTRPWGNTYNALTHTYEADAFAAGIVDPALVTRMALEAAVSAVGTLITTHATVTESVEQFES